MIAQTVHCLFVHFGGNLGRIVHGVEVGDERHGYPVIAAHAFVAADDYAVFAGATQA
jgi:hypothetical protein